MKSKKKTKLYEWQQKAKNGDGACGKCKRTDHLTVDHIIPISLIMLLGIDKEDHFNDEENFQFLCRWCNTLKGNNLDHLNPKTIPLLKQYVKWYEVELSTPTDCTHHL